MSFYFVCPGEASVTSTSVQCSQSITTLDSSEVQYLSYEQKQTIVDACLVLGATLAVIWLCKKALDL